MTSESRITHRVQAATGKLKKLVGLGRDEDYQSWVVSIEPEASEPAGKGLETPVSDLADVLGVHIARRDEHVVPTAACATTRFHEAFSDAADGYVRHPNRNQSTAVGDEACIRTTASGGWRSTRRPGDRYRFGWRGSAGVRRRGLGRRAG
jgi:hypothetical protein